MKVLIINGSPRVGGNTTLALSQMIDIFKELIQYRIILKSESVLCYFLTKSKQLYIIKYNLMYIVYKVNFENLR